MIIKLYEYKLTSYRVIISLSMRITAIINYIPEKDLENTLDISVLIVRHLREIRLVVALIISIHLKKNF